MVELLMCLCRNDLNSMSKNKLASCASVYLASNIINAAISFALLPIFIRYMGLA